MFHKDSLIRFCWYAIVSLCLKNIFKFPTVKCTTMHTEK